MRQKVFTVTLKDCRVDTFRSGGKGGQNQNKVESGVRVVHPPSGAVGEARDSRDQLHNKRSAFKRMAESRKFQIWAKAKGLGMKSPEEVVDEWMREENIRVEYL